MRVEFTTSISLSMRSGCDCGKARLQALDYLGGRNANHYAGAGSNASCTIESSRHHVLDLVRGMVGTAGVEDTEDRLN